LRHSRITAVAFVTLATFADIVAYSICVPVLPDFARRLGASPAQIGLEESYGEGTQAKGYGCRWPISNRAHRPQA